MEVVRFILKPMDTNCYVLYKNNRGIVIDPGGDVGSPLRFIEEKRLEIEYILNTHLHFDHTLGNKELKEKTGAKILANKSDLYLLETELGKGGIFGLPVSEPFNFEEIDEGEYKFIGEKCKVLSTPGHTPGSLSFYFPEEKVIFVGDLIFRHSVGRTDFPGGDFEILRKSIKEKVLTLPEDTIIYPGHGEITTVGEEKLHNPFIRD